MIEIFALHEKYNTHQTLQSFQATQFDLGKLKTKSMYKTENNQHIERSREFLFTHPLVNSVQNANRIESMTFEKQNWLLYKLN